MVAADNRSIFVDFNSGISICQFSRHYVLALKRMGPQSTRRASLVPEKHPAIACRNSKHNTESKAKLETVCNPLRALPRLYPTR